MPKPYTTRRDLLRWTGWFLTAQCLVFACVSLRYLLVGDLPPGIFGGVFGTAMYAGHYISLAALLFLPLLLTALLLPRRGLVIGAGTGLAIAATAALVIDTFVYQQYRFHINGLLLSIAFSSAADDVFVFSAEMIAWAVGLTAILAAGQIALAFGVWRLVRGGRFRGLGYASAAALTATFLGQNLAYAYFDAKGELPVMQAAQLLPLYDPLTARSFLEARGFDVARSDERTVTNETGAMTYPRSPLRLADDGDRPNILFVVLESWRFDAIGPRIAPHIHRFAENRLRFNRHFSGGNSSRTGLFALFYGIPGTYWHSALHDGERPALIDVLAAQNYRFFVSASSDLTTPPYDRILFRGIDGLRVRPGDHSAVERDRVTADRALRFLRKDRERPFFGFVFFAAPHAYAVPDNDSAPFQPSWDEVNYMALGPDFDPAPFFNRYRNAVHFADTQVGRVLETLRRRELLEDTIVVITGDHGQEFNDSGQNYWGHNSNFTRYQTQVPMVMHWPGRSAADADYITSHMDVAPTLLDEVFGADDAHRLAGVGRSLFRPGGRLPLILSKYSEYAAITRDRIIEFKPWGAVQIRDKRNRLLPDAAAPPGVLETTLERISVFRTDGGGDASPEATVANADGDRPAFAGRNAESR